MKAWDELTERGRIRRLRDVGWAALERYPVEPVRLRLVGGFTNLVLRVDTTAGPLALRIDHHQDHSDDHAEVELAWLAALAATDIDVCTVVPARDGARSVHAGAPGVPGERRCVLFDWVPGVPLARRLTPDRYHRLGQLSAALHVHGAGFVPPSRPIAWDRVFNWPEEFDPVVHDRPEHAHHFAGGRREIVDRAIAAVEPAFAALEPGDAQVIHGDLHPDNVHVHRERMIAIDFEDVTWGHRVQDVAVTLFYERDHPGYADLRAAFEEGYRSVAPWPVDRDGQLEHFMAARTIAFVNYVLNLRDDPRDYLDIAIPRLARFLDRWT